MYSSSTDLDSDFEEDIILHLLLTKKRKVNEYLLTRKTYGQFRITLQFPDNHFTDFYRLNRQQFTEVHELIKTSIESYGCNAREPIGTEEKLAVFLRYLVTGDCYKSIAYSFRMGDRTVSNIVKEVSIAIWKEMQPKYLSEPTTQTWKTIASKFEQRWQFPHCVGALDGKHVVIKKPEKSGSYYNHKDTFSVVLFAAVDADYKFITVDVGAMGRCSDKNLFSSSTLGKKMKENKLLLPKPEQLPTIEHAVPYVFVGDEAFPLSENLMRPYPRNRVTGNYENQIFNARLFRARRTVECAFSVLFSQFHVFRKPIECQVKIARNVVKAACVLHNYLKSSIQVSAENVENMERLLQNQFLPLRKNNVRNSLKAFKVREQFTEYFNNWGAVP